MAHTSMMAALSKAGYAPHQMRAYSQALEFIKSGGTLEEWTSVYQQAAAKLGNVGHRARANDGQPPAARVPQPNDSAKGRQALASNGQHATAPALSPKASGGGRPGLAVNGQPLSADAARTQTDGGGRSRSANDGPDCPASPVRHIPLAKRGLAVISAVQEPARISLMDTLRVRDGRSIGDIWTDEYETIRTANAMEASIFRQLQRHGVPGQRMLTRDFINVETLQRMQQRAAEVADAN